MEVTTQKRRPSRCREWERIRRNKFNDTITKLGEVAKDINKTIFPEEEIDNTQCPKIEIIQKAIVCLTNCSQQITHLKAEILAIQVELDTVKSKKVNTKDATTQVFCGLSKNRKDRKCVQLLMIKKAKAKNDNKDKPKPQIDTTKKLPILLPKTTNKKGPENTIVVLPATPYIIPPRPLLFPTVPPTFVLIDQNLQPINKSSIPIVNRNNGDITKTTMVNILPISAYSHPLSAMKSKKSNVKLKSDVCKKVNKKSKSVVNIGKESSNVNDVKNTTLATSIENKNAICTSKEDGAAKVNVSKINTEEVKSKIIEKQVSHIVTKENNICKTTNPNDDKTNNNVLDKDISKTKENDVPKVYIDKPMPSETEVLPIPTVTVATSKTAKTCVDIKIIDENKCITKGLPQNKSKDNKLPNILPLDASLCDNVVDTGNARLELAEEFLATSPTAAFLMSFPLVSGNRADSPSEDHNHTTTQNNLRENQRRNESTSQPVPYIYEKPINNDVKVKSTSKPPHTSNNKQTEQQKSVNNTVTKESNSSTAVHKPSNIVTLPSVTSENPFLNLSMPSVISTTGTLPDTTFSLDFDCNINKSMTSQSTNYATNNNFFYKSDPFGSVKNTIYSTSSITSSHEFNSIGLYPCAMEKYTSKNKPDFSNVDDNIMKIGSSRLTYDIDLGWSHKGLDFVNCTTTVNTFNKDNLLTTTSAPYASSYNPFNADFHVPLATNSNKKENSNKVASTFAETITSFYPQPANLWTEDVPFYTNSNITKNLTTKSQNYPVLDHIQANSDVKLNNTNKHYITKMAETNPGPGIKSNNNSLGQGMPEKYTKKSPNKMHINWMTSEIRSAHNNCNPISQPESKETHKSSYNHVDHSIKKHDNIESNYFPISMPNCPTQTPQDEFQVWPSSTRPLGTTEISIDPPPLNLPTLVGDLALGPHDKNKRADVTNRLHADIQNCGNFLSVTQLMNRSTDNMQSRFQAPNIDASKTITVKQHVNHFSNDSHRKGASHLENHMSQPCYVFNDPKLANSYDNMSQFTHSKTKSNSKTEKTSKTHKNNYSTEALLRGANCTQKVHDTNSAKFMMPPQKYSDYSTSQDTAVAQVSHFPPIIDYSDNSYATQQYSGTALYNSTTNTISNSFYSNFMPGSSNLMTSNYASGPFPSDFIDYNQTAECNYANHKYEELKMRNNTTMFQTEKVSTNYKNSRRESASKHKLECSKKESNKKYQSKKAKINNEIEEWNDSSHILWQNKSSNKKHTNLMADELPFPNYVGNQMPTQYQSDYFNSHLMPSNMQNMGHNVDRSISSFPVTSRANFNLSTIFPEITMKVQG